MDKEKDKKDSNYLSQEEFDKQLKKQVDSMKKLFEKDDKETKDDNDER